VHLVLTTLRKDLNFLEERGKLIRLHGAAVLAEEQGRLRTIATRQAEHTEEKPAIAPLEPLLEATKS